MIDTQSLAFASVVAAFSTTSLAQLGDLNPPGGPVTETGPTLQQIEPRIEVNAENTPGDNFRLFIISEPGSYFLTGDVDSPFGTAILIDASDVTLDLNGFTVTGGNIAALTDAARVTVENGRSVDGGVAVQGPASIIRDMQATDSFNGFTTGKGGLVVRCTANGNSSGGFDLGIGSTAVDCVASGNDGNGFESGGNSSFKNCVASENMSFGFSTASNSVLNGCLSHNNAADGFRSFGGTFIGCAADDNGADGFDVNFAASLSDCVARRNGGNGFTMINDCRVEACFATNNTLFGIDANWSCSIERCSVINNAAGGIEAGNFSVIAHNNVDGNGNGAAGVPGILMSGDEGRIDSNTCTDSVIGIQVTGEQNLITRNAVIRSSGFAFDIAALNVVAEIQNVAVQLNAVQGSSGGGINRNRVWGNFAY